MENQIRIVVLDYYISAPVSGLDVCYSDFRGAAVAQVPVLRCFGSNGLGQKICVHIHGAFPYLYIPYDGSDDATKMSNQLAADIDKALNTAMNQTMSNTQHVYKVSLVSGIPMYGYHFKKHQFFKIHIYNPMLVSKFSSLLMNQSIMGKVWQPHEAHLNFTLQFMIDYNLHGMSNMLVENLKYRVGSKINTGADNFLPPNIEKITTCEVEGDINAKYILNRQEIISGKLAANPGIACLWEDEKQRRRNKNETSQLGQFIELKNVNNPPTKSHEIFKEALLKRLAILADDNLNESVSPLDVSIYPAEAPDNEHIQNASIVDFHTPSSYELSLEETLCNLSQTLDNTISQNDLNVSLEDTDKEFLKMLQEMAKENEDLREEDCILTQTVLPDESIEKNDSTEDNLDMTMSLEEITGSLNVMKYEIATNSSAEQRNYEKGVLQSDEDMFNTTIPQLDGHDEYLEEIDNSFSENDRKNVELSFCEARSLPNLDVKFLPNNVSHNARNRSVVIKDFQVRLSQLTMNDNEMKMAKKVMEARRTEVKKRKRGRPLGSTNKNKLMPQLSPQNKIDVKNCYTTMPNLSPQTKTKKKGRRLSVDETELHSFIFQVKEKSRRDRYRKVLSSFNKTYRSVVNKMEKSTLPKFRAVPQYRWWLAHPQKESTIISEMLKYTKNHTDANLHLLVKTPDDLTFLYFYGGRAYPDIMEVPFDILPNERKMICQYFSQRRKNKLKNKTLQKKQINMFYDDLNSKSDLDLVLDDTFAETHILFENLPNCLREIVSNMNVENNVKQSLTENAKLNLVNINTVNRKILNNFSKKLQVIKEALQDHVSFLKQTSSSLNIFDCKPKIHQLEFGDLSNENNKQHANISENSLDVLFNKGVVCYQDGNLTNLDLTKLELDFVNNNLDSENHWNSIDRSGKTNIKTKNKNFKATKYKKCKQSKSTVVEDKGCKADLSKTYSLSNKSYVKEEIFASNGKTATNIEHDFCGDFSKVTEVITDVQIKKEGSSSQKKNAQGKKQDSFSQSKIKQIKKEGSFSQSKNKSHKKVKPKAAIRKNVKATPKEKTKNIFKNKVNFRDIAAEDVLLKTNLEVQSSSKNKEIYSVYKNEKSILCTKDLETERPFRRKKIRGNYKEPISSETDEEKQKINVKYQPRTIFGDDSEYSLVNRDKKQDPITSNFIKECFVKIERLSQNLVMYYIAKQSYAEVKDEPLDVEDKSDESKKKKRKFNLSLYKTESFSTLEFNESQIPVEPTQIKIASFQEKEISIRQTTNQKRKCNLSLNKLYNPDVKFDEPHTLQKNLLTQTASLQSKLNKESKSQTLNENSHIRNNLDEESKSREDLPKFNFLSLKKSEDVNAPKRVKTFSFKEFNQFEVDFSSYFDDCKSGAHEYKIKTNKDKLIYLNCDGALVDSSSEEEEFQIHCWSENSRKRPHVSESESLESEEDHMEQNFQILVYLSFLFIRPQKIKTLSPIPTEKEASSDSSSNHDNLNTSFFQKFCHNETATIYDLKTGFMVKEGCSKVLTPEDTNCKISQENIKEPAQNKSRVATNESSFPNKTKVINITKDVNIASRNACQSVILKPLFKAPSNEDILKSLEYYSIATVKNTEPYYSDIEDCTLAIEVGQNVLHIPSKTTVHLQEFESFNNGLKKFRRHFVEDIANLPWNQKNIKQLSLSQCTNKIVTLVPIKKPPSFKEVEKWVAKNVRSKIIKVNTREQIRKTKIYIANEEIDDEPMSLTLSIPSTQTSVGHSEETPTPKHSLPDSLILTQITNHSFGITGMTQSSFDFEKSVQNLQAARSVIEYQYLTTVIMELHVQTRGSLKPDPEYDQICGVFYTFLNDFPTQDGRKLKGRGVYAVNKEKNENFISGTGIECDIIYVDDEKSLIMSFTNFITYLDPDILAGYEIEMLSWGFFADRAKFLGISVVALLGRSHINKFSRSRKDGLLYDDLETAITGRIVLDVWRLMRHEVALQSYTFESIVYKILHRRIPKYSFNDLTSWWDYANHLHRHKVVRYYLHQVESILEILQKLDFINRTSELAKLFGILFYEVLSRGSQFRVESMMLRLAKPLNYIPVSPSQRERAHMKAPEFIPLVMEPESKMYNDPVIVLDFQSLYPSIVIAYNYCFTTCMGRVELLGKNVPFDFGATQLKISRKVVEKLAKRDLINYAPCGVAFVKRKVREGILPRMLKEILDTRLMVKNAMKENKEDAVLQKVLHNRQLGLKLIANVTYGYTAANFSGRMCCVEVGDSVVSKGRETLQRAIAMVDGTKEWGARVVYGDTDSLFVCVPGKSKEATFEIGKKIAEAVSIDNPDPVKLKLEKVYQPCILQTKKRYVGYMYESPGQKEPVFDAKGIETVRRDGCPAASKMLEKCLHLLFETKDVSLIKKYVIRQFSKIQSGKASIQDLTFAKEFRGAAGYKPGACVPALELTRKWTAIDRRNRPRNGERVPYVIINGPPGLPLIRLVRSPYEVLNESSLRLNSLYYITKVLIPPINRCLSLIGADLNVWFNQMPRKSAIYLQSNSPVVGAKTTLSQYFASKVCASCTQVSRKDDICEICAKNPTKTALVLFEKIAAWERKHNDTKLICQSCTGSFKENTCISLDCPVLYRKTQNFKELQQAAYLRDLLNSREMFVKRIDS